MASSPNIGEEPSSSVPAATTTTTTHPPPPPTTAPTTTTVSLGGPLEKNDAAYALLDGLLHQDADSNDGGGGGGNAGAGNNDTVDTSKMERITIPITYLPAIIGRSHDSNEPNFFGLGSNKAISRKQCTIHYRDADGGRVEWDPKARVEKDENGDEVAKGQLVYLPPDKVRRQVGDDAMEADKLIHNSISHEKDAKAQDSTDDDLPPRGFFVLECLGKNRLIVDNKRVQQGHSIVLKNGSTIRISSYCLYFFLPTDATNTPLTISSSTSEGKKNKNKNAKKSPKKKRPATSSTFDSPNKKVKSTTDDSTAAAGDGEAGASGGSTINTYQNELDGMSSEELLSMFNDAMKSDTWDRRTQLLGSSICARAVMDAGRGMISLARKEGDSLSRKEIIDWIAQSERYSDWVVSMHEKMESRSYVSSITRSLLRVGYVRNAGSGRYIRWILPDSILSNTDDIETEEKPDAPDDASEDAADAKDKAQAQASSDGDNSPADDDAGAPDAGETSEQEEPSKKDDNSNTPSPENEPVDESDGGSEDEDESLNPENKTVGPNSQLGEQESDDANESRDESKDQEEDEEDGDNGDMEED